MIIYGNDEDSDQIMDKNVLLSFVIPCYRSEKTIETVIDEIIETVGQRDGYDYEVIAVNDCSPDSVGDVLRNISAKNKKVKVVNLVKNMGKHSAVLAGYSYVSGDYVVNLDDDCQSPVNNVWMLYDALGDNKCDIALAQYSRKKESWWKQFGSRFNLFVSELMLDKPKGLKIENFSIMKRFVADEIVKYKNPYPYLEGLMLRVTGNITTVRMDQRERGDDKSTGFGIRKSLSLFANGFTNFSVKPLRAALILGVMFAIVGFIYAVVVIVKWFAYRQAPLGWSSMMSIILIAMGINMILLGVIGEYVGRIFICINNTPQFIVRDTINIADESGE